MKYFLGVDMGSSSMKATLLDEDGGIVLIEKVPVKVINLKEGFFEIDANETWWRGFESICEKISMKIEIKDVHAICISSLCGTFVPVDDHLDPVYNAILYSIDTRSSEQVERLNNHYGESYLLSLLGGIFTTHSIIPKILWIKENLPIVYQKTRYFIESNNFITSLLTGKAVWDYPTAMGSQLVNINNLEKPLEIAEDFGIDTGKIPDFAYPTDLLGNVCSQKGKALGFTEDTKVFVGACDINAEAMSLGSVHPGDMTVVFGSTLCTLLTLSEYKVIKGFRSGISVLKDTYRLGTASATGARFTNWIDNLLRTECRLDLSNFPTGIMMLPYLDGVRSPFDNPKATPVFLGMKHETTLNDLCVAAREAIGYEIAMIINMLERDNEVSDILNCTGGLANIPKLMQNVANITGKKLRIYNSVDASYGDALIAISSIYTIGEIDALNTVQQMRQPDYIAEPEEKVYRKYRQLSEKYNKLYGYIKDIF